MSARRGSGHVSDPEQLRGEHVEGTIRDPFHILADTAPSAACEEVY